MVSVSKRHHTVPFGELNGVPLAFMARFGVISKSRDRIRVSHDLLLPRTVCFVTTHDDMCGGGACFGDYSAAFGDCGSSSDIKDAHADKLTTAMMLLARAITQRDSTPTNNRLRTSSNTRNQAVIQDDEAGGNLNEEENDSMLDNHYGDDSLKELNATVNASQIHLKSQMHSESVHEHTNHAKIKTAINTSDDDQNDSNIIFDDPYVENYDREDKHDSNAHDQSVALESLIYNVKKEAQKQPGLGYQNSKRLKKAIKAQPKIVRLLETSLAREIRDCVMLFVEKQKNEMLMLEKEKMSNDSKDIQATMEQRIKILENDFKRAEAQYMTISELKAELAEQANNVYTKFDKSATLEKPVLASSSSVSRSDSKDINSKKRVLLNTKSKSTSKDVKKSQTKTINVVHDGSNLVCVSCGKDVFMISHDKCVARYALSPNSRFSVATPPKATNKDSSTSSITPEFWQSQTLSAYMKNDIRTSRKWQKWFEHQSSFNWSPKSSTSQTPPSDYKSSASRRTFSRTLVTKKQWVAKLPTLPSSLSSCGAGDLDCPLDC
ncbi:hypothetical protein Tco_0536388 [Tanacetum coccineum]